MVASRPTARIPPASGGIIRGDSNVRIARWQSVVGETGRALRSLCDLMARILSASGEMVRGDSSFRIACGAVAILMAGRVRGFERLRRHLSTHLMIARSGRRRAHIFGSARLEQSFLVVIAEGPHPIPSRTRKLSPPAPMVLQG